MAPEFQSFGAGGLEPAFWQTSISIACQVCRSDSTTVVAVGLMGQGEPRASHTTSPASVNHSSNH